MGRKRKEVKPLPTIWHTPDALWERVEPLIAQLDPPKRTGRKRINPRAALDAIIYHLRTGCQWNRLPGEYPDDSSVHRTLQRWDGIGLFDALWAELLLDCEELQGVDWRWQAADAHLGKARGVPKKGQTKRVSARTRPTEAKPEPSRACW